MEFFEIEHDTSAKIKVVGCGGGGGNAVNNMIMSSLKGVQFIVANTDAQDIHKSMAEHKIQMGEQLTKGLGAGANPEVGCNAALESEALIREALEGADMVFITAGMGGGTGTGSAPVVARIAKEMGALTVGVVTKPFYFEGKRRLQQADQGTKELSESVDSIITIPNDRLLQLAAKKASFADMLKKADEVLYYAVKGIADLITVHGLINLDFADVKAVMGSSGMALMGTGIATGESRAKEAAMKAITSPLLEDVSIEGAKGVLINITCGPDMLIDEVSEAADIIYKEAHDEAEIFFGTVFDPDAGDEMRITVIATGIQQAMEEPEPALSRAEQQKLMLLGPRGMKRPATAEAKPMRNGQRKVMEGNLNIPAYLRKGGSELTDIDQEMPAAQVSSRAVAGPGEEEFIFEEDDFDVPAFIRKNCD
ncbi:cell division protein FtsZ [Pseudodesulfovibrio senegalensis]|uniref:Cell division protein FtsZ n=1 Tax=Pseudodesulfovibrio senegalensis TaxID=1721087 RepID=A0A6N6N2G6_9BACT|nr:cell division protein FtsZ [Pseudodesulfovibrio senegalensis]KAB1442131.1 cell division protein FtsZ [Pseudodesulfovibrio senegalensis]